MASEEVKDPSPANSRRNFLKQAGATVAAVAFVGIGVPGVLKDAHFPSMAESGGAIAVAGIFSHRRLIKSYIGCRCVRDRSC